MGPLGGIRVLEVRSLGPGPYAGMLLADLGADVIVVERRSETTGIAVPADRDIHMRGKRSIALDLKSDDGLDVFLLLAERADVLLEGFRPGVAERLGIGPENCQRRNPGLVYGRLTGWGQDGPLSDSAGHDINYIALAGALAAIGGRERPTPPLNIVGDYAAGSLFLVIGVLAALFARQSSGKGDVIDAAIVDGAASLMGLCHTLAALGSWAYQREANLLDGGAPNYRSYRCADGGFVAVGALEPEFLAELLAGLDIDPAQFGDVSDPRNWPDQHQMLEQVFATRPRDAWCAEFTGTDACVSPVLDVQESHQHRHLAERKTYANVNGIMQAAAVPRFSRNETATLTPPHAEGADSDAICLELGLTADQIDSLRKSGALT